MAMSYLDRLSTKRNVSYFAIAIVVMALAVIPWIAPLVFAASGEEQIVVSGSGTTTIGKSRMSIGRAEERIASAVESGNLTQVEADEKLAKIQDMINRKP
jgi:hypothetical protein